MRRLYSTDSLILAGQIESLLKTNGIGCLVRNQFLGGAAGELPLNECWPEIWVVEDAQFNGALVLLDACLAQSSQPDAEAWSCPACAESIEPQFSHCWRCGAPRT